MHRALKTSGRSELPGTRGLTLVFGRRSVLVAPDHASAFDSEAAVNVRCVSVVTAIVLATAAVAAQQASAPPDQRPPITFRSEITFVEIDAIVTDRGGRFVPDLTRDDFQVIEEGKPQQIAAFAMMHIPVAPPAPGRAGSPTIEPDAVSNHQPFEGRIFLLLLDDLQTDITRTRFVREAAREFIEQHVAPNDVVAVAFTSGRSMGQDFTASRARLRAAIDRFSGNKLMSRTAAMIREKDMTREVLKAGPPPPVRDPYETERMVHARASLSVVAQMSEFLGGIRGRRKALVYFGEGIDHELVDVVNVDQATVQRDTAGVRQAMRDAVAAATRSNVSVYTIDPRGLSTGAEEAIALPNVTSNPTSPLNPIRLVDEVSRSHLWMRSVAGDTGGMAFLNTNDTAGPLRRIVEDSSSYYILGYYAPPGRKDGRFRNVDVRVTRPGLEVRARKGYHGPGGKAAEPRAAANARASAELQEAMRSPLPVHGLAFSASAAAFQGKGPEASVVLVVEIDPAHLAFAERGGSHSADLELLVIAADPLSKTSQKSAHHLAALRLQPDTYAAVKGAGIRITRRLDLRPGRYRIQIGVRDTASGAVGTLFGDLDVPDFRTTPLGLSGVLLVSAAATRMPTVEPDPALAALLPGAHTARREFPLHDTLAVFAEVYDNDLATPHRVAARTTILAEDGTVVFSATDEHASEELVPAGGPKGSGGWGHRVTIPAATLGTGRFILRVEAVKLTGGDASVMREVAFTIR
jgi:VWFA-related protein